MKLCNFCCVSDQQSAGTVTDAIDRRGAGKRIGDNTTRRVIMIEYEYQLPGTGLVTFRRESFSVHINNTAEELIDLIIDSFGVVYTSSAPFTLNDRRGAVVLESQKPENYCFASLTHGATLTMLSNVFR